MKTAFLALNLLPLALGQATVYLIRHGEKPSSGNGLTAQGEQRAQCLTGVFGPDSDYDIGHIMAETPQSGKMISHRLRLLASTYTELRKDGSQQRPYDTVEPLAQELDLAIDTSCSRDDEDCVADVVNGYTGSGNILICWEHHQLNNIAQALGAKNVENYPDDSYNLIWTDPYDYSSIVSVTSEDCPGISG